MAGDFRSLIRMFGHDWACAERQNRVGAVVDGDVVCDTMDQRRRLPQIFEKQGHGFHLVHWFAILCSRVNSPFLESAIKKRYPAKPPMIVPAKNDGT